jgi:hypothetical protein
MKELLTLARAIDASFARMNRGLAAVAIYLAILVVGLAVIRAGEYLPIAMVANMAIADQPLMKP